MGKKQSISTVGAVMCTKALMETDTQKKSVESFKNRNKNKKIKNNKLTWNQKLRQRKKRRKGIRPYWNLWDRERGRNCSCMSDFKR